MESRLGHDFSRIRVHADREAAQSAADLGAAAYTVGNHVVFGESRYAPGTPNTHSLMAHELRHVQQHGEAIPAGPLPVAPPDTALERDADEAALRCPLSASAGGTIPRAPVQVQRQPTDQPPDPSRLRLPEIGESLRPQPLLPLLPIPRLGFHLSPENRQTIESYLTTHRLAVGSRFQPTLDGMPTTIDGIVDGIRPMILPLVPRSEIEDAVRARYSRLVLDALFRVPITIPDTPVPNFFATPPPAPAAPATAAPITTTAGTNMAWHVNLTGPPGGSRDATLQLQIGEDAPLQRVFQISYNLNNQQVQAVVGGQATADVTLVKELLKLSGFVQVLAGVAWTGTPASGVFTVLQPSAGAQLTLTWRGIQFAVQASASITAAQGQPTTGEVNVTPQVTIPLFPGAERRPARVQTSELTGLFEIRDWVTNARYSEIERLPSNEKARLVRVLLSSVVIILDVDAISRIWNSISSPSERQQIRSIIEGRVPTIDNPDVQARLRRLISG
jgi:hypothetical protein